MDKSNKPWNKDISTEEIFNREFSIGYLIQSNQHLEMFKNLKQLVLSTYEVIAEFEYLGYNGDSIYANNQCLVYRPHKNSEIKIGKNVEIIQSNLSNSNGGSNKYPRVSYEGAKITLKFISYGLPFVNKTNGWSIKIIDIKNIQE